MTEDDKISCCAEMAQAAGEVQPFAGGGALYPEDLAPLAQVERGTDGSWYVNGCCGGGCAVLIDIKFCPFCGKDLP